MAGLASVKRDYILKESEKLFLSKGIDAVLIKDVALKAEIGEATIYRYFQKKSNLVIEVALDIQKKILSQYFNFADDMTGFELLKSYYAAFLSIFVTNQSYFNFLKELDVYILKNGVEDLRKYEEGIADFGILYQAMVEKGIKDGSVKSGLDYETFYYSSTHALLGLCEKLSLEKAIIKQDESQKKNDEIKILIASFLDFIKA